MTAGHQPAPDPAGAPGRVEGVLFDIDDTLVDFTGAARRALPDAVRRHLGEVPETEVIAAWEEVAEPGYSRFTSGELGFAEMLTERTKAFVVALAHPDATTDIHVAIENDRTGRIFDHYRLFDDVRPELRRLRAAGLRVGAVSNSDGDYQRRKLATVGLADEFDATVFSGDLGVAKPDPADLPGRGGGPGHRAGPNRLRRGPVGCRRPGCAGRRADPGLAGPAAASVRRSPNPASPGSSACPNSPTALQPSLRGTAGRGSDQRISVSSRCRVDSTLGARRAQRSGPLGYGVIGNTADSGSAILGSSPSTPARYHSE